MAVALFKPKAENARPSRREALDLRPWRNPNLDWYEDEEAGTVVLHIRRAQTWKTRALSLLVPLPDERKIALDAIGSDVWRLCDGKTTIRAIARRLADSYQLTPREAEISVGQFFKDLGRRGYIALLKDGAKAEPQPETAPAAKAAPAPRRRKKSRR